MVKKIRELVKGDIFLDGYGMKLRVEETKELPFLGIPNTRPRFKLVFITEAGHRMRQNFFADREVEVLGKVAS